MKSFRQTMLAICVILIASTFAGCGADTDLPDKRPALERIEYTNLNDSGSRALLKELLSDAGVPDGRIQSFFRRAAEKTGGTGIPPVKSDLHHQIHCLSDHTTPFLLNKQNLEHTAKFQAVCSGFYCLDWRS